MMPFALKEVNPPWKAVSPPSSLMEVNPPSVIPPSC